MIRATFSWVLMLSLTTTTAARVDEIGDAEHQAKIAFNEAVEHFNSERYAEADEAFRQAYRLKPSWKLLYNIGQCEAALKRYGRAYEAFESYLLKGGDDVPSDRQESVRQELSRLRDLSGELEVLGPDRAKVLVDDIERGTTPLPGRIRVAGGLHQIQVIPGEETLLAREIKMSGRGLLTLEIEDPTPSAASHSDQGEPQPTETPKTERPLPAQEPPVSMRNNRTPLFTTGKIRRCRVTSRYQPSSNTAPSKSIAPPTPITARSIL